MNVAPAISVGQSPTTFMTARSADQGGLGADALNPSDASENTAATGFTSRYPRVALSYNHDASRLVMLFRDPVSGDAVAQIPSKVVVKQYQEAQIEKRRAEEQRRLEVVVGDPTAAASAGGRPADAATQAAGGQSGASTASSFSGRGGSAGSGGFSSSPAPSSVVSTGAGPAVSAAAVSSVAVSAAPSSSGGASAGGQTSVNVVV